MKFKIKYGLDGGFGGKTEKDTFKADNKEEAEKIGRLIAIEYAEQYEDVGGIPSIEEYGIEHDIANEEEAYKAWVEMMDDMWIVYTIKPIME